MVYFIKNTNDKATNIDLICKTMVNMEQNKHIFDKNGKVCTDTNLINKPFNQYVYNKVEYDITISLGVIVIYNNISSQKSDQTQSFITDIVEYFNNTHEDYDIGLLNAPRDNPVILNSYNSTHYNIISRGHVNKTTNITGKTRRKIIKFQKNPYINYCTSYVWMIKMVTQHYSVSCSHLSISELSQDYPTNYHLSRSVSTIILDENDMFDVKTGTKQINYPSMYQYTAYKTAQIVPEKLSICNSVGLDIDMLSYFTKYDRGKMFLYKVNHTYPVLQPDECRVRRLNPDKPWNMQIDDVFDYNKQELLEKKSEDVGKAPFSKDVCFISQMPLYGKYNILEIGKRHKTEKSIFVNRHHIAISPLLMLRKFPYKTTEINIRQYIQAETKYSVINIYISTHKNTELDIIESIPSSKITPSKRDLLKSINKHGICSKMNILYTVNLEKNIIYVGFRNVTDFDIIKYKNTSTILFNYQ
jgi:hypothetical protein